MFNVDMNGAAEMLDLKGLLRVECTGDKINLVFEGEKGGECYLTASAMRDGDVWTIVEGTA